MLENDKKEKPKSEKRAMISIGVSAEEKRRISVEALKDYETSVSELIRSRMFVKTEDSEGNQNEPTLKSEEVEVYKDVIQQLKDEIIELKDQNSKFELQINENKEVGEIESEELNITQNDNMVLLNFSENSQGLSIIKMIRDFRTELFKESEIDSVENFPDFKVFAKTLFLRGLKRSYNNGILKEGTGLNISEIENFSEQEGISYSEDI